MFYKTSKGTCKSCTSAKITERYHNDPSKRERVRAQAAKWQDDNMIRYRWLNAKNRSAKSGLEFAITVEHLESLWEDCSGNCYYTGLPMVQERSDVTNAVSLDRLDSSKGYVPGNVVLCRSIVNIMKNDLSEADFSAMILVLAPWAQKISARPH